jgi:soluble lytic murein transglycosylase
VEDRSYLWGRFALHAARRHDPEALEWFDRAQSLAPDQNILDKEQLAWHARAAMRVQDWSALQSAISDMPVTQQQEAVWRYWEARALKEQKKIPDANAILVPLSREPTYYGLLAEEELGDALSEPPSYYRPSEDEVSAVKNLPGIQRAMELQRMDLRWESRTEWTWATRGFDDQQMIAAAELAARQEWYDLAIITAEKTTLTHDFSLRYPTPYRDLMKSSAREQGLDEAWVYGLTRQESRFISYAKSGVGASGLMQVMPATAKWIAKRLGLNGYHNSKIGQLDTNIQLGTYYMRHVLDQMDGQLLMATAAYNAGPSRAKRWAASQPLEGAIYAETIPFSETRNYVQKVMGNAYFYAHRLGIKIQTLKQRLGVVAGSGGVLPAEEGE